MYKKKEFPDIIWDLVKQNDSYYTGFLTLSDR